MGKRPKVLIGANDMMLGGVQRLVIDQLVALTLEDYEVHLAILMEFPGRETFDTEIPSGVHVHRLGFHGLPDVRAWLRAAQMLRSVRPDVVKTATFFSNSVFLILRPFFGYEVIAAEHNTLNVKPLWQRLVDRLLYPTTMTVVGDSQMVVDFVSKTERVSKERFTVLYNGVDVAAVARSRDTLMPMRSALRAELGVPESADVILTVARLVRQKNHVLMMEAFARVLKSRPNAYLIIVGDGAMRATLEEKVREHSISERVILTGERKDVHRFYAVSDVFLLTSRHEGFCIAAMEALAFGIPVVSTRVAGIVEYLLDGENGYFVEPDADDVARKIDGVFAASSEKRGSLAESARATAENYSVERYRKEFIALVKTALR